jgi:hypothetical protein
MSAAKAKRILYEAKLERKLKEATAGLALVESLIERGSSREHVLEVIRELREAAES